MDDDIFYEIEIQDDIEFIVEVEGMQVDAGESYFSIMAIMGDFQ